MRRLALISCLLVGCVKAPNPQGPGGTDAGADATMDAAAPDMLNDNDSTDVGGVDVDEGTRPDGARFIEIAISNRTACALERTGTVHCWGANDKFLLLDEGTTVAKYPPAARRGFDFRSLDAGRAHMCGGTESGVECWGDNLFRQTDDNPSEKVAVPNMIFSRLVIDVSAGLRQSCAVTDAGGVWCWGSNAFGVFDSSTSFPDCAMCDTSSNEFSCVNDRCVRSHPPESVAEGLTAQSVTVGDEHICVMTDGGEVHCWGNNVDGQAVPDEMALALTGPTLVGDGFSALDAKRFTCGIKSGSVKCWGSNDNDQTGITPGDPLPNVGNATHVAVGDTHACALLSDGSARCWGKWGPADSSPERFNAPDGRPFLTIGAGSEATCASTSAALYCWGNNVDGVIGQFNGPDPEPGPFLTPTPVDIGQ